MAATERRPSTNLASISSRSSPALLVRLPSVCAASAIEEAVGFDAHVEFGADVDAHAILGDQRIRAAAGDLEPQCLQIDRGGGMENRKHDRAAVEDDFLAAEAGADIGFVTCRAAVEFGKQKTDNKNDNDANSDGYCKFPHVF